MARPRKKYRTHRMRVPLPQVTLIKHLGDRMQLQESMQDALLIYISENAKFSDIAEHTKTIFDYANTHSIEHAFKRLIWCTLLCVNSEEEIYVNDINADQIDLLIEYYEQDKVLTQHQQDQIDPELDNLMVPLVEGGSEYFASLIVLNPDFEQVMKTFREAKNHVEQN